MKPLLSVEIKPEGVSGGRGSADVLIYVSV